MSSFSIEVPGEANPLTEAAVERTLRAAASNDVNQIQTGTKQLQAWGTHHGFYSLLQGIFLQKQLPPELRMLSLIQMKNGVDKYWRKSATNAVSAPERTKIRERLLDGTLDEPMDRLATLNSIVTAKIARYEYPSPWSDLIKSLITTLNTSTGSNAPPGHLPRALMITHHILKELVTIRMQRQRQALLSAAPELLGTLQQIYFYKLQQWQPRLSNTLDMSVNQAMRESEQTLKILRRLLVAGYDFPHRHEEVRSFWHSTAGHVHLYLQMHHRPEVQNAYRISASQHAKQLAKLHVNMAKDHGVSFALLPDTPNLVRSYWNTARELRQRQLSSTGEVDDDETDVYDSFNLRAVLLLRACFKEAFNVSQPFKYRNEAGKDEPQSARLLFTNDILTKSYVKDLFETLVTKFFVYLQSDIEEWISEPEEWDMKDESDEDAYETSIRAASERLLLDITLHHKDLVIEPLLETAQSIAASDQPLLKDAVYSALGIAAPILHKKFDFNHFLSTSLIADMQRTGEMYSVVRRRIVILCARWIRIDVSQEKKPLIYAIFQDILDPGPRLNNQAARITAAKRLHDIVDELAFEPQAFKSYVPTLMTRLLDLIREVSLAETKLALLKTVSTIVLRMESEVDPYAEQIVGILQTLWAESASENMLKAVIVTILRRLVQSMKARSMPYHKLMFPTIRATVEPGSDLQIYLLDDVLELWNAILQQTTAPASEDLLSLIQYVFPLFETEDALDPALLVSGSYILLSPHSMLHDGVRKSLLTAYTALLSVKKTAVIDNVCSQIELLIRSAEGIGGEQAVQVVVKDLMQVGFLPHILNSLHLLWESHQSTGPHRKDPPRDWKNESPYLVILARIILSSIDSFLVAVHAFSDTRGVPLDTILPQLLEEAFAHMDAVGQPSDGKVIALALTKLLETGQPWILGKLQDLMSLWTSMVMDLRNDDDDETRDSLVYKPPTEPVTMSTPERDRLSAVTFSDPVHTIVLGQYVQHHLRNAIAQCGGEKQFQDLWLVDVDKDVLKAFGELEIM